MAATPRGETGCGEQKCSEKGRILCLTWVSGKTWSLGERGALFLCPESEITYIYIHYFAPMAVVAACQNTEDRV